MKRLDIDHRFRRLGGAVRAKNTRRPFQQLRQVVIWFACTSNSCDNSASVFSPLTAAHATFALNAGLWFRRGLLLT